MLPQQRILPLWRVYYDQAYSVFSSVFLLSETASFAAAFSSSVLSSSLSSSLNSFTADPKDLAVTPSCLPNSGSLLGPKISAATPPITTNSGSPRPNKLLTETSRSGELARVFGEKEPLGMEDGIIIALTLVHLEILGDDAYDLRGITGMLALFIRICVGALLRRAIFVANKLSAFVLVLSIAAQRESAVNARIPNPAKYP
mmetsp:Transcript_7779/g.9420  ORF Transcript_7779/g.9420 Transcript_7779/m.9420 type:complete len:201 (+) Transcript_7779:171-773(+)